MCEQACSVWGYQTNCFYEYILYTIEYTIEYILLLQGCVDTVGDKLAGTSSKNISTEKNETVYAAHTHAQK